LLKAASGILLAGLTLALFPTPAYAAITDPDVMEFDSVSITRNLYEDGDMLLAFHYAISWTVEEDQPDEPADETFLFRLMDDEETETLGNAVPYPYVYNGYGEGAGSMYWDALSAPEWEGNYILRLEENPGLDPDPTVVKRPISGDDYSPYEEQEDNQSYLRDYIIDLAIDLEVAWAVEPGSLIGDDNYLTAAGETYFIGSILGLNLLCPDLFALKELVPTTEDRDWTLAQQTSSQEQWEGTWIQDSLDGLSGLFGGVGWSTVTTIACIAGFLGILAFSHSRFETVKPGFLLGILPMIGGAALGFFSYVAIGLICFGCIIFLAYTFWFKGAS